MDLGLTGKTSLVTGASSGIGAAVARLLAGEGADVVIAYHQNVRGAAETEDAVRGAGRHAWSVRIDQADQNSVVAAVADIRRHVSGLDVVVLNAGRNVVTPFEHLDKVEWDEIVRVNLTGPFQVLQAVRPLLRDGAGVVTVASVAAATGAPRHAHYAAAKAGLVNLTRSAARALAPRIRVNCVAPGIALTAMGTVTVESLAEDYAATHLLAGRFASPDEIARCIVFLASPAASFVYGATFHVNGGRDLR